MKASNNNVNATPLANIIKSTNINNGGVFVFSQGKRKESSSDEGVENMEIDRQPKRVRRVGSSSTPAT